MSIKLQTSEYKSAVDEIMLYNTNLYYITQQKASETVHMRKAYT